MFAKQTKANWKNKHCAAASVYSYSRLTETHLRSLALSGICSKVVRMCFIPFICLSLLLALAFLS